MNQERTLLYLASGEYRIDYDNLPFDKLIFVDRSINFSKKYPKNNSRISFICADALNAIDLLKIEAVKVDCLVSINEGIYEGGGTYPIFSDFLMGYLSPLLNDKITLVCNLDYYSFELKTPMSKLDWGFEKVKMIKADDPKYINPSIFTSHYRNMSKENFGHVFKLMKVRNRHAFHLDNFGTTVRLIHGSIWEDEKELDLIGLNLLSKQTLGDTIKEKYVTVNEFFLDKHKVLDLQNMSFEEILLYCKEKQLKKIGLTPWLNKDYRSVIEYFNDAKNFFPTEINFYHLNKKDFQVLYSYFLNKNT